MWSGRFPPTPDGVRYSVLEQHFYDPSQFAQRLQANNIHTYKMPKQPILGKRRVLSDIIIPQPIEGPEVIDKIESKDILVESRESWSTLPPHYSDSFANSEEDVTEFEVYRRGFVRIPLSLRILQKYFGKRQEHFAKAIKAMLASGDHSEMKPTEIVLYHKPVATKPSGKDESIMERLIPIEESHALKAEDETEELSLLRRLSITMNPFSYEHLALYLRGCGQSMAAIFDSSKVNTYLKDPDFPYIQQCLHSVFGERSCIASSCKEHYNECHRRIKIETGTVLPAYVAAVGKPKLKFSWFRDKDCPNGLGDKEAPQSSTSICLPIRGLDNSFLGVTELVRFKDEHMEYSKKELCQAGEVLTWIEIALQLSLKINTAYESILSNKLFRIRNHENNVGSCTVEETFMNAPKQIFDAFKPDYVCIIRHSKDQTIAYSTQMDGTVRCFTTDLQRNGVYYTCAKLGKHMHIVATRDSMSVLNPWLMEIYQSSTKQTWLDFDCCIHVAFEPVYFVSKKSIFDDNFFTRSPKNSRSLIHPIVPSCKTAKRHVIAVIVLVSARHKRKPKGVTQIDKQKLGRASSAIATSIRIAQLHENIHRKLQLLDLATEIMDYHCTPAKDEVKGSMDKFVKHRVLFPGHAKRLKSIEHLSFDLESDLRISLILMMLQEGTQFEYPLEKIAYFALAIRKRCFKMNPYTNIVHAFHALQASYYVYHNFGHYFEQTEITALMVACYGTSLGHRGVTKEGMRRLNDSSRANDSPIENFHAEIVMKLLCEGPGLIVDANKADKSRILQAVCCCLPMKESGCLIENRHKYANLPDIMDWTNLEHRNWVLEMLSFLCMREYIFKPPDLSLNLLINHIMLEFTNQGYDEMANGFPVHPLLDVERWAEWPSYWMDKLRSEGLFIAEKLKEIIPRASVFEDAIKLNLQYLKENEVGVLEEIKSSLHIYSKFNMWVHAASSGHRDVNESPDESQDKWMYGQ